ncbi:MFS transporter [Mycolicibacterium mengxianglii]|uniref:MFS transporter n=1 Tax=Mycolicibacterium mengxianglii TaxID=2736649 RepID=UPI0018EF0AEA|nr:MFS transporter [Mycolicibacterium mengxianglii]
MLRNAFTRDRPDQPSAPARSRHPGFLIAALCTAGIGVSLMQTLMIPVIPDLPQLLDTSADNASWAITATLLVAAVATPVFGRLGDMYGPQRVLVVSALVLTAGAVVAATSHSLLPLIIGRGLQGFGMPIIPLGISVLRASVPADRVGSAMGMMSSSLGVGGALGLPLGAVIAENLDWHALFWFATGLGVICVAVFVTMVPHVPASSRDRFDPLGAVLLGAGLVCLLLPISKGGAWGWTSPTTLVLFGSAAVVLVLFGLWQLRYPSPIVDLRTTVRLPVLTTNVASIGVGVSLYGISLVAPQILELPKETGYGLGQSVLHAGLWMAPGGLAMMVASNIAARVAARRGPKFTLVIGCLIVAAGYLTGFVLLRSAVGVLAMNVVVSVGVGFAFSSLPALINSAVPMSETAAANGINSLARALGTSLSSAVIGAILGGMTMNFAGHQVPTETGLHVALGFVTGAAVVAALLALLIPKAPVPAAERALALRD